jgi:hypothetical protein
VRWVVEVAVGEHLPKPTRREEVALRQGSKLKALEHNLYLVELLSLSTVSLSVVSLSLFF